MWRFLPLCFKLTKMVEYSIERIKSTDRSEATDIASRKKLTKAKVTDPFQSGEFPRISGF